jgi:signal transduction histidine kinase
MTTLRTVIAYLATAIRGSGAAYVVIQVAIWHSYYTAHLWRLAAPVLLVAWAVGMVAYLRKHWPSTSLTWADSAVYLTLALTAEACVPPAVRDNPLSWLVIAMSGQLIVPAWYAPAKLSVPLVLSSPLAYLAGAELQRVTNTRMMTGAAILLLVVGLAHRWGRRILYARAARADAALSRADQAARERYASLCANIERREQERLLHDTILNTLTAVARGGSDSVAEVVTRCRQDIALMEAALGGASESSASGNSASGNSAAGLAAEFGRPAGDLPGDVRGVAVGMRARGLTVHLRVDDDAGAAVPAGVSAAISSAVREALATDAAHAGTGEAWVSVRREAADPAADDTARLRVTIRDQGAGFDLAHVDQARLGLRRSITERLAEHGGQASVWSVPGQGTAVSLTWPAPAPAPSRLAAPGPGLGPEPEPDEPGPADRGREPAVQPW